MCAKQTYFISEKFRSSINRNNVMHVVLGVQPKCVV